MIRYLPAFAENVAGRLYARFQLDQNDMPRSEEDDDGTTFYYIEMFLDSPNKAKITRVTYNLDASYYEPTRHVKNRDDNFREEITAYGDYLVKVEVHLGEQTIRQSALLSEMLEEGHKDDPDSTGAIRNAITYIRVN
jgi:pYEATS domain-containing protein involved in immunity